jgi:release factor glutamine methyltransferase
MADRAPPSPTARRVGATLREATRELSQLPHASPRLEAELLLEEATGWPRARLLAWPEHTLDDGTAARFDAVLRRRLSGEPLAYILGRQAFWTLDLKVTPDTLIPRPETELLVEIALALPDPDRPRLAADLGTGSGAIAAAVASERPSWMVIAADRSAPALAVARENFRANGLATVAALRTDWLAPFAANSFDLILSNPPYVAAGDPHLSQGDLAFEPASALASGPDGLADIRGIAQDARRCLKPGGLIALEHGFDQGQAVRAELRARGLVGVETLRDLAGHERATLGFRSQPD